MPGEFLQSYSSSSEWLEFEKDDRTCSRLLVGHYEERAIIPQRQQGMQGRWHRAGIGQVTSDQRLFVASGATHWIDANQTMMMSDTDTDNLCYDDTLKHLNLVGLDKRTEVTGLKHIKLQISFWSDLKCWSLRLLMKRSHRQQEHSTRWVAIQDQFLI